MAKGFSNEALYLKLRFSPDHSNSVAGNLSLFCLAIIDLFTRILSVIELLDNSSPVSLLITDTVTC